MSNFCLNSWRRTSIGGVRLRRLISSGAFTIQTPNLKIIVVGGGAGGGSGWEYGGGGAGGAAIKWVTGLTVGHILEVVIGSGGAAYAAGGTTRVYARSGSVLPGGEISATGGLPPPSWIHGGSPGIGVNGHINVRGGPGESYGATVEHPVGGSSILGGGGVRGGVTPTTGGGGGVDQAGASGLVLFQW
jgi:hypothetical protein